MKRYFHKQFKSLGARAVKIILNEHIDELLDLNDPENSAKVAELLSNVQKIAHEQDLNLYNPKNIVAINDDVHSIFRIFPNGTIIVSTVI